MCLLDDSVCQIVDASKCARYLPDEDSVGNSDACIAIQFDLLDAAGRMMFSFGDSVAKEMPGL